MKRNLSINEITEEILQSIISTPKKQKRLKSSTFWRMFGVERRNKDKISLVKIALEENNIFFEADEEIGFESKDKMIKLSYLEPTISEVIYKVDNKLPKRDESWFENIENRIFSSEREVEQYFISPILQKLDYTEEDCAIGHRLNTYSGVKKERREVDFAVFNGINREKENALMIVEAKSSEKNLTLDSIGQARSYASYLSTPYYIVTNGNQILVFLFRGGLVEDNQVMNFNRKEFHDKWQEFYNRLCKSAVIKTKKRIQELMNSIH